MGGNTRSDQTNDAEHGDAAVPEFRLLGEASLKFGEEACRLLVGLSRLEQKLVLEGERSDGSGDGDAKDVDVGDENDGTLHGDGGGVAELAEHAPVARQRDGGVRDEPVTLAVAGGNQDQEAKHGVAAVPALGLDCGAPAAVGEGRIILLEILHGLREDREHHAHADRCAAWRGRVGDARARQRGALQGRRLEGRADGDAGDEGHCRRGVRGGLEGGGGKGGRTTGGGRGGRLDGWSIRERSRASELAPLYVTRGRNNQRER